ncbi:hypothetical protein [Altericroceibacterium xinjiangense]|uniref:hypothetical protein n=1 Tax=Altericroceibacterium xinjiangense TaxID=762261 RepID=UPI000F7D73C9|nr:hypothetical protein [Altericroceibacterium xinjiangense]
MPVIFNRAAVAAGLALAVSAGPAVAQDASASAPIPRASGYAGIAALPDWSGVWNPEWSLLFGANGRRPLEPKLTPAAQAKLDTFNAEKEQGLHLQGQDANCVPPGMPRIMRMPYPIEFIFSPGRVTLFNETYSQVRRIHTDGRPLPEDPDPFFNGSSIGHWEGDTLVVDTIGFHPSTTIAEGVGHGPNMRIRERIRAKAPDVIMIETTITDPDTLAEPFVQTMAYERQPGWEIREYVCNENNRDAADEQGRPSMDLGLDGGPDDPFGPLPADQ